MTRKRKTERDDEWKRGGGGRVSMKGGVEREWRDKDRIIVEKARIGGRGWQ